MATVAGPGSGEGAAPGRWWRPFAAVAVGLAVGLLVAVLLSARPVEHAARLTVTTATSTGQATGPGVPIPAPVLASLTSPAVLREAAAPGTDPAELAGRVEVEALPGFSVVRLVARADTAAEATRLVRALAAAVVDRPLAPGVAVRVLDDRVETYVVGPDGVLATGAVLVAGLLAALATAVALRAVRVRTALAAGAGAVAALAAARGLGHALAVPTPSEVNLTEDRMQDFRDATYYPIRELLAGGNPYSPSAMFAHWPVRQEFDLYQPYHLLVHLPFGLPPYRPAAIAFAVLVLAQLVLLCWLTARRLQRLYAVPVVAATAVLAAFVISSQVGNAQLYVGQVNAFVAIGTTLALFCRTSRPWWAAVGLALAWLKPQFGLPLAVLLAVSGAPRVSLRGTGLAAIASLPVALLLVVREGGVGGMLAVVAENLEYAQSTGYGAVDSLTGSRVDVAAVLFRTTGLTVGGGELVAAALVLAVTGVLLRRLRHRTDPLAAGVADLLVCLAVLISVVHQPGDVLIALPAAAVLAVAWWRDARRSRSDWALLLPLALVAFPFDQFGALHERLAAVFGQRFEVTVDGVVLLVAWLTLAGYAALAGRGARREPAAPPEREPLASV